VIEAEYGIPVATTDYHELLNMPEIDAVIVALPNYLHAPVAIDALDAGKHVLVEKPMAIDAEAAQAMLSARDQAGRILMVGQNNRFRPEAVTMEKMISSGRCGEVYNGEASWWRRHCGQRGWFADKQRSGGDALVDIGVHALYLCWWLMRSPQPEYALGMSYERSGGVVRTLPTAYADTPFTVDDLGVGLIKLTDGRTLYLGASWGANTEDRGIVITVRGKEAGLVMDNTSLRFLSEREGNPLPENVTPAGPVFASALCELHHGQRGGHPQVRAWFADHEDARYHLQIDEVWWSSPHIMMMRGAMARLRWKRRPVSRESSPRSYRKVAWDYEELSQDDPGNLPSLGGSSAMERQHRGPQHLISDSSTNSGLADNSYVFDVRG
jgi:predicted dehydrogenase